MTFPTDGYAPNSVVLRCYNEFNDSIEMKLVDLNNFNDQFVDDIHAVLHEYAGTWLPGSVVNDARSWTGTVST